jgi:hypothetical protein
MTLELDLAEHLVGGNVEEAAIINDLAAYLTDSPVTGLVAIHHISMSTEAGLTTDTTVAIIAGNRLLLWEGETIDTDDGPDSIPLLSTSVTLIPKRTITHIEILRTAKETDNGQDAHSHALLVHTIPTNSSVSLTASSCEDSADETGTHYHLSGQNGQEPYMLYCEALVNGERAHTRLEAFSATVARWLDD